MSLPCEIAFHQRRDSKPHVRAEGSSLWCTSDLLETSQAAVLKSTSLAAKVPNPVNNLEKLLEAEVCAGKEIHSFPVQYGFDAVVIIVICIIVDYGLDILLSH